MKETVTRLCEICSKPFTVDAWLARTNPCRYCSPACNGIARRGSTTMPELRESIVKLFLTGEYTVSEVARLLHINKYRVYDHLHAANIATPRVVGRRKKPKTCLVCNSTFMADVLSKSEEMQRFCSHDCYVKHRLIESDKQRDRLFWEKVDKNGPIAERYPQLGPCWEWLGSLRPNGYGQVTQKGKPIKAHRISWILTYGEIPTGMNILHRCDNRRCVNPSHLWEGTQAENLKDMRDKGRARGGNSKPIS